MKEVVFSFLDCVLRWDLGNTKDCTCSKGCQNLVHRCHPELQQAETSVEVASRVLKVLKALKKATIGSVDYGIESMIQFTALWFLFMRLVEREGPAEAEGLSVMLGESLTSRLVTSWLMTEEGTRKQRTTPLYTSRPMFGKKNLHTGRIRQSPQSIYYIPQKADGQTATARQTIRQSCNQPTDLESTLINECQMPRGMSHRLLGRDVDVSVTLHVCKTSTCFHRETSVFERGKEVAVTMSDVASLTDAELRKELASMGYNSGAVTGTTRKLYEKKLLKMRAEHQKSAKPVGKVAAVKVAQATPPPVPKLTSTPKTTPPRERPIPRPAEPTPVSSAEESNSSWKHDRQVETSKSSFTTMRSNAFIVDTPTPPKPKPKAPTTYYKPSPRQPEPSPTPLSTIHGFDDSLDRLTDKAMRSSFTSIRSNAYQDRTPTPPRASAGLLAKYLPSSSKSFKNLGDTSGDDTDDDGHTESCRQIDPTVTSQNMCLCDTSYFIPPASKSHVKLAVRRQAPATI
uniref:LEM domain-containing protein n=1 Tax=Steinernema glaseri TaxID=37863 RepID=A0A1I7ZMV9_9BILA